MQQSANDIDSTVDIATPPDVRDDNGRRAAELVGTTKKFSAARLLWDWRQFLFRVTAFGILIAVGFAFTRHPFYTSKVQLMPPGEDRGSGMGAIAGLLGGSGLPVGDMVGTKSSGALYIQVMRSRTVESRLVDRFHLKDVYGVKYNFEACDQLNRSVSIDEERKSGVVTITVNAATPALATQLAGAYVEELNRLLAESASSAAYRERVFLEERLSHVQKELTDSEHDLSDFSSAHKTTDIQTEGKTLIEAAARLNGDLIAARSELKGLEQVYAPDNVRVRSVKARIAELQVQLDRFGGGQGENDGANRRSAYPDLESLPRLGATFADLLRRVTVEEKVFATLTEQYELAKVKEAKEIPTARILDPASVPEVKAGPSKRLIVFRGALMAFFIGMLWVFLVTVWYALSDDRPLKMLAREVGESVRKSALYRHTGRYCEPVFRRVYSLLSAPVVQPDIDFPTRQALGEDR